jgi:hypothetical protein
VLTRCAAAPRTACIASLTSCIVRGVVVSELFVVCSPLTSPKKLQQWTLTHSLTLISTDSRLRTTARAHRDIHALSPSLSRRIACLAMLQSDQITYKPAASIVCFEHTCAMRDCRPVLVLVPQMTKSVIL